jgi:hypothetical protein
MRAPARASSAVVILVVVVALTGCTAVGRPDAQVARRVEEVERQRVKEIVLASADEDEVPLALLVAGAVTAASPAAGPEPVASVPGNGSPDRFFSLASDEWPRSFSFVVETERSPLDDMYRGSAARSDQESAARPKFGLNLFRLTIAGHPVSLRCSIKHKHLMFGAKIAL